MTNREQIETIIRTSSGFADIGQRLARLNIRMKILNVTPSGVGGTRKWEGDLYMQVSKGTNLYSKAFFVKIE